ncbi:hypothetical protein BXZ70DRAFT_924156 [Cristinia sonorae]|uniref:F-box domain-containing protein n=1 Tax=Cristinia sonorae TaxID=1940300 RepID=A0A8K0UU43_9AGAR|nr:hypothetical protein BXZ70DRAFT_924156 [Cristinia sonorae]
MTADSPVPIDPQPPPPPTTTTLLDPEEQLAKFREEWKAEVRRRRGEATGITQPVLAEDGHTQPSGSGSSSAKGKELQQQQPAVQIARVFEETQTPNHPKPVVTGRQQQQPEVVKVELVPRQRSALEVYQRAIACEQRGELDEALQLYRKAFRVYDDVDRLFTHMGEANVKALLGSFHTTAGSGSRIKSKRKMQITEEAVRPLDAFALDGKTGPGLGGYITGTLAKILSGWEEPLRFLPEEGREREPTPIAVVPDEVLVHILSMLDVSTLERFATVNRKARVLTLESSIWRAFVEDIYQPPQIGPDDAIPSLLPDYLLDYRRMFIEHPRIRLDGVYIAVLHYTRRGLSENAWVNISHLITYHRYLRFYPDGTVLSLLANEEVSPQQVIPIFKPSLRMKGFYIGNWRLLGTDVYITDLTDPTPSSNPPKYTFQMRLGLKSRPVGRWNRLDFVTYESVTVDGEATPLLVKHDRPFWFSKVKSYEGL